MTESIQCYGLPPRVRNSLHCLSCTSLASGSGSASEMYKSVKPFGRGSAAVTPRGGICLRKCAPAPGLSRVPPVPQRARGYGT